MPVPNPLDALAGMERIASIVSAAARWIGDPHNWVRILEVVGGGALLIIGVTMLGNTGAGPVADTVGAGTALPGKVVKTVASVK